MLKINKVINIGNNPKAMAKTYQKQKTYKCCISLLLYYFLIIIII
jgi:hypothetical protein